MRLARAAGAVGIIAALRLGRVGWRVAYCGGARAGRRRRDPGVVDVERRSLHDRSPHLRQGQHLAHTAVLVRVPLPQVASGSLPPSRRADPVAAPRCSNGQSSRRIGKRCCRARPLRLYVKRTDRDRLRRGESLAHDAGGTGARRLDCGHLASTPLTGCLSGSTKPTVSSGFLDGRYWARTSRLHPVHGWTSEDNADGRRMVEPVGGGQHATDWDTADGGRPATRERNVDEGQPLAGDSLQPAHHQVGLGE
jgi:hypothetical protein